VIARPAGFAQHAFAADLTQKKTDKPELSEEEKINMLIKYVRTLQGSTFIRNGKESDLGKAADHYKSK